MTDDSGLRRLRDRLEQLMLVNQWNQAEVARRTGLSPGLLSGLLALKKRDVNRNTLERLSLGLMVPQVYFTAETPREFMEVYLATLPDYQKKAMADTPFLERLQWILGEMQRFFGDEYNLPGIAAKLGYDLEDLEAPLKGERDMAPGMVQTLAEFTGAGDWLIRPQFIMPDHIRRGYDAVTIKAWTHGVGPEPLGVVVDTIIDAAKQVHTDNEKKGGQ